MTQKLNIGYCGGCEAQIFTQIGLKTVPNEMYAEIVIVTNKNQIAVHGVCKNCANTITEKKAQQIFARIQETWHEEMGVSASQKAVDEMRSLKVSVVSHSEDEALKLHRVKKEKERLKVKEKN